MEMQMPTPRRSILAALLSASLLGIAGCGEEAAPPAEETIASDPADGLELQFGVQKANYAPGDSIRAVVRVENRSDELRTLEFSSSQRFDIIVLDSAEVSIHSWSADKSFLQALEEEILEPGGELRYDGSVIAPAIPGGYLLKGVITTTGTSLESTLPIAVDG
jgi:hypothetical protein